MSNLLPPINLERWVSQHRHLLMPPVGNKLVFEEQGFFIMVVGGPNERKDFHYEEGAEFFYQLEGDLLLKIYDEGKIRDIWVREGEVFLLPPRVPHSPQRLANTVGLVVERSRAVGEKDALKWYCDDCNALLYEEYFELCNIEKDFPPVFERFYSSKQHRSCKECGQVMSLPPIMK